MKKTLPIISITILLASLIFSLPACAVDDNNVTFDAYVEDVGDGLMIYVDEADANKPSLQFSRASVHYADEYRPSFDPAFSQKVRLIIWPEVAESYPVQVWAVRVVLLEDALGYLLVTQNRATELLEETTNVIHYDLRDRDAFDRSPLENARPLDAGEISGLVIDDDAIVLLGADAKEDAVAAATQFAERFDNKVYAYIVSQEQ